MVDIMSERFVRQLEELHVELITMGSLCEKAIANVAKATEVETDKDILAMALTKKYDGGQTGAIVDQDGMVYTVGYNANGEIGNETVENLKVPVCISKLKIQVEKNTINFEKENDQEQINYKLNMKFNLLTDEIPAGDCTFTSMDQNVATVNDKDAVKVDLEDDGRVIIYHTDKNIIAKTKQMILDVIREVEEGKVYTGKITKVEDFGCFVELWPGCEGLVHVSQLAWERVEKPSDMFSVGDEIMVKSLGYDNRGRLNLSRKECLPKPEKKEKTEKNKE